MHMAWCGFCSARQLLRAHAGGHAVLMRQIQMSPRPLTYVMPMVQEVPVAMMSWESDDTSSDQDIAAIVKTASTAGVCSSDWTLNEANPQQLAADMTCSNSE
jgi:hypothetical protein